MPTGVTISSLLLYAQDKKVEYDIYVLIAPDVNEEDRNKLTDQVKILSPTSRISFVEMGEKFESGYEIRGISKACYYRLMIPWLLPQLDKVIYSDVDIIFKTTLEELYNTDLTGIYVAGAIPFREEAWKSMAKYFATLGLDYKKYINSGMLVINCELQRRDNLKDIYDRLAKEKYLYQDQDIINITCKGRIGFFHRRFNLMPIKYQTTSEFEDDVVLHYSGDKPWVDFTYAWAEWWEIYNRTIFKEEGFYCKISAKILNPMYHLKSMKKKSKDRFKQFISNFKR